MQGQDLIIEKFLGGDPIAGAQALQELLALGTSGEELLFSRAIKFPDNVQVRRRWLRYVASRHNSVAERLIDRLSNQERFKDAYGVAYLFAGLEKNASILEDLSKQIEIDFPTARPAASLFQNYSPVSNRFMAWGYAGGSSAKLWDCVANSSFAWEKLKVFAFRGSCASVARLNATDCWAIEQLITHEIRNERLEQISTEPEEDVSYRAISNQELWLQASLSSFATWRRGEVVDAILRSWPEHAHWRVRDFGAQVLATIGYRRTVTPIAEWLGREHVGRVRASLLHALERSESQLGADILVDHFLSKQEGALYVAKAAWRAGDTRRATLALNAIVNDEGVAGSEAVVSLAKLGCRFSGLPARLESTDDYRRLHAVLALAYLRDKTAIQPLAAMRREAATSIERAAILASLALLEESEAVGELNRELIAGATSGDSTQQFDIFFIHRHLQQAIVDALGTGTGEQTRFQDAWRAEIGPLDPVSSPIHPSPSLNHSSSVLMGRIREAGHTDPYVTDFSQSHSTAVILTALEVETRAVLRHLWEQKEEVVGGTVFLQGYFGGWSIAVAEVGPGNSSASAIAERAIQRFKPSVALFVGVAGGIKDVAIGDVVVATKVYGYESGKETEGGLRPRPILENSSHALQQRGRAVRQKDEWKRRLNPNLAHGSPRIFVGPIAAGEKVIAATSSVTAKLLRDNFGDALAVEMEGHGFLGGVQLNSDVQGCVIRGISDLLDKKSEADARGSQELAADAASATAMEILFAFGHRDKGETRDSPVQSAGPAPRHTLEPVPTTTQGVRRGPPTHIVLLVHGIRDFARWQDDIRKTLEEAKLGVELTNYGRMNLFKFLLPLPYFRKRAAAELLRQIYMVLDAYPGARISVIAHSFGTFAVSQIIKDNFNIRFHRIIFCGSVVPYNFKFEDFRGRFEEPIINEVGTRDPWPAIAESVTWGYGSAGTYGFRRPFVRDRWHNGAHHGFFLNAEFCKKYWVPALTSDEIISADEIKESQPGWIVFISTLKLKFLILLALLGTLIAAALLPMLKSDLEVFLLGRWISEQAEVVEFYPDKSGRAWGTSPPLGKFQFRVSGGRLIVSFPSTECNYVVDQISETEMSWELKNGTSCLRQGRRERFPKAPL